MTPKKEWWCPATRMDQGPETRSRASGAVTMPPGDSRDAFHASLARVGQTGEQRERTLGKDPRRVAPPDGRRQRPR